VSVSAIGKVQAFNSAADGVRRTAPEAAHDDEEVSPVAAPRKPGAGGRHRDAAPVTIDLRPDPPDEDRREARQRAFERFGPNDGGSRHRGAREAAPEPQWTYRSNSDTPYRRRTSEETYEAIETVDTTDRHRGGIYDRRI
jgi:hypothetical protein